MTTPRRGGTPRIYGNPQSAAVGPGRYADGSQVPDATRVLGDKEEEKSRDYFARGGKSTAAQNPSEVGTYAPPQQSIAQRSLSMIPSATLDKLAQQQTAASAAAGKPATMSSQYGTGSVAFVPRGSALADHGRVFNDGKDVTAQTMGNVAQSGNPEPQAPAVRPTLDLKTQQALVKQYPNIGIAGHPEHQAFLDAYTKAYDPNKPMTADQVTALAGGLYPKPETIAGRTTFDPTQPNLANTQQGPIPSAGPVPQDASLAGVFGGTSPQIQSTGFGKQQTTTGNIAFNAPQSTAPVSLGGNGVSSVAINNPTGQSQTGGPGAPGGPTNVGNVAINNPGATSSSKFTVSSPSLQTAGATVPPPATAAAAATPTVTVGGMTLGGTPPAADGQSDDDKKKNKGGSVFGGSPIPVASAAINPLFP